MKAYFMEEEVTRKRSTAGMILRKNIVDIGTQWSLNQKSKPATSLSVYVINRNLAKFINYDVIPLYMPKMAAAYLYNEVDLVPKTNDEIYVSTCRLRMPERKLY